MVELLQELKELCIQQDITLTAVEIELQQINEFLTHNTQ